MKNFDVEKIRADFPMLSVKMHGKPLIYLDTAATAQKPQMVIDKMSDFYQNHYGTVHRAVYELAAHATAEYHNVRKKVAAFLNAAKTEEIIYTKGTTESINLVAYSFGKAFVKPGDEVLISEMEHHSNIVPWQLMCEERKATLKVIPINDQGEIRLDEYEKLLNPKTKIVSITHISNALGTKNPIKKMTAMAHAVGAKVVVDAAQSAPHIPIDVQDLDVDFLAFSGHKLFGPTGIGILYGKAALLEQMPPYQGGGDMIDKVTFEKSTYNAVPMKFEAGTPSIAQVFGLGAAIDYLKSLDSEAIMQYEEELLKYATELLLKVPGLRIIGTAKEKGSLISFFVEGTHPLDIGTLLDLQGIAIRTGHHCAQPVMQHFGLPGTARASFAFYNTKQEIDHFANCLQDIVKQLKG